MARYLNKFCAFLGPRRVDRITPSDCREFLATNYPDVSVYTLGRIRTVFVGLFDAAVADGYIRSNPFRSPQSRISSRSAESHRQITPAERTAIEQATHVKHYLVAMLMLYAGLRPGEAYAIDIDRDVDF